jgi:NitT/TauT family transport system ATP-binding protein
MSTFLEVKHISKRFDKRGPWVLKDINFSANQGDFISFIGPSGCGKTTLLKLIAGLVQPTEGAIRSTLTDFSKNIGYVFQDHNLLPWLNVRQNIELPFKIKGIAQSEYSNHINQAIHWLKLDRYCNYYPWQLSGGTKMRVSIARALALEPQILLFDEPFATLDEMTRYQLNEDLTNLQERSNWTAFFVTHSISEAVFLSTDVYVLSETPGQITEHLPIQFEAARNAQLRESFAFQENVSLLSAMLRKSVSHTLYIQPK